MKYRPAPEPTNEGARLNDLESLNILDTLPEPEFDDLAFLASELCETPMALVSLIDSKRQWFKARVGIDVNSTPREYAFCAHAILEDDMLVVEDSHLDERFRENPLVLDGPKIRFYAGAPLRTARGNAIGTLCVLDRKPRKLSGQQQRALQALGRQAIHQLELRRMLETVNGTNLELARRCEELSQLAIIVSHDFRAPLGTIGAYLELLRENTVEHLDEAGHKFLDFAADGTRRLQTRSENLLEFARAGRPQQLDQMVDLDEVVDNALDILSEQIRNSKASVFVAKLPAVWGDPVELRRVFEQLFSNAIKFRGSNPPALRVDATPSEGVWRVLVEDNGIGIAPSEQSQVFRIGQTLHDRDTYSGSGVGLAIVKKIMQKHGGKVVLRSAPHEGSIFELEFPEPPAQRTSSKRGV